MSPSKQLRVRAQRLAIPETIGLKGSYLFQPDLKDARPQFPADKNPSALRIIGNAIEHGLWIGFFLFGQDAGKVEIGFHLSGGRIDADDPIGMPNIPPDLPVDIFELV